MSFLLPGSFASTSNVDTRRGGGGGGGLKITESQFSNLPGNNGSRCECFLGLWIIGITTMPNPEGNL